MYDDVRSYVVVIRPEPGLSETINEVQALGWQPLSVPIMTIEVIDGYLYLNDVQALVFTSRQAVKPTVSQLLKQNINYHHIPVFTVGDVTAQDALTAGFVNVYSAHKDAVALAELLKYRLKQDAGKILLISAENQGECLVNSLIKYGFIVDQHDIYRVKPITKLPDILIEKMLAHEIKTILFFSSQSAQFFIDLLDVKLKNSLLNIQAIGISEKVKLILNQDVWRRIDIASHPSTALMLSLLKEH